MQTKGGWSPNRTSSCRPVLNITSHIEDVLIGRASLELVTHAGICGPPAGSSDRWREPRSQISPKENKLQFLPGLSLCSLSCPAPQQCLFYKCNSVASHRPNSKDTNAISWKPGRSICGIDLSIFLEHTTFPSAAESLSCFQLSRCSLLPLSSFNPTAPPLKLTHLRSCSGCILSPGSHNFGLIRVSWCSRDLPKSYLV